MEMKLDVVYEIKKSEGWRGSEGIEIKSNIAKDELVDCQISKSLVEYLKKESSMLDPDKLLLGFAEAQKRGIQENLEALDDMALTAKNKADAIQEKLLKSYEDNEEKYLALEEKFTETENRFISKMSKTREAFEKEIKEVDNISKKLHEIDNFGLEKLSETLKNIISIAEQDSELMKLVLEKKKK